MTKYLHDAFNDISVTKFLGTAPTYNTFPANTDVNKRNVNMTII